MLVTVKFFFIHCIYFSENIFFQIQELHYQMTLSTTEINNYQGQIKELQMCQQNCRRENENLMKEFQLNQLQVEDLSGKLENEKQLNSIRNKEIFTLKNKLRDFEDKLDYVTKEKEVSFIVIYTIEGE